MFETLKGFPTYEISREGKIRNRSTKRELKLIDDGQYVRVNLYRNKNFNKRLHRLLAIQFIPNPNDYPFVDHIDRDKKNNSLDNLRWCNARTNQRNRSIIQREGGVNYNGVFRRNNGWGACITDNEGNRIWKYYSSNKYGEHTALELAVLWRLLKEKQMGNYRSQINLNINFI